MSWDLARGHSWKHGLRNRQGYWHRKDWLAGSVSRVYTTLAPCNSVRWLLSYILLFNCAACVWGMMCDVPHMMLLPDWTVSQTATCHSCLCGAMVVCVAQRVQSMPSHPASSWYSEGDMEILCVLSCCSNHTAKRKLLAWGNQKPWYWLEQRGRRHAQGWTSALSLCIRAYTALDGSSWAHPHKTITQPLKLVNCKDPRDTLLHITSSWVLSPAWWSEDR